MAPSKLTSLASTSGDLIDSDSRIYIVNNTSGTPASKQITLATLSAKIFHAMACRVSLTSNTPVTTGDVTNATTVYITPVVGQHPFVSLWYSSAWQTLEFTQKSVSLSGLASNCYDVFLEISGGSIVASLIAWTNTTTRATALITQDGILMATSTNKVYVGTIYLHATGQCDDADARRGVWSFYNRKIRRLAKTYNKSGSASYTTASWRQYEANSGAQVQHVYGYQEDFAYASIGGDAQGGSGYLALGLNSTTGQAPAVRSSATLNSGATDQVYLPNLGLNTLYMTEFGATGFTSGSATIEGYMLG